METEINAALALNLQAKWEIVAPEETPSVLSLQTILAERIVEMLKNELGNLLFIMYRMDIEEGKFQAAMKLGSVSEIAQQIAQLVIERELQKIHTRRFFA